MDRLRFALLGDPVDHSLSPAMHRRAFADAGLEGSYETIRAGITRLREEVERLRTGETNGLNVTMPLKEEAALLCDLFTPEAERSGSVSALKSHNGRVIGHSTDVVAFREILDRWAHHPFCVLGAGGAARAALAAVGEDATVFVSARRHEAALALAERFDGVTALSWDSPMPGGVLINATPLGMRGESLPDGRLESCLALVDLPYGRQATPAVTAARELGIPVVDGIEFLAIQAAAVFTWWTGESVDSVRLAEEATKT